VSDVKSETINANRFTEIVLKKFDLQLYHRLEGLRKEAIGFLLNELNHLQKHHQANNIPLKRGRQAKTCFPLFRRNEEEEKRITIILINSKWITRIPDISSRWGCSKGGDNCVPIISGRPACRDRKSILTIRNIYTFINRN